MGAWSFGYDNLNRLTSATAGTGVPAPYTSNYGCWAYDDFGNRTAQSMSTTACNSGPPLTSWATYTTTSTNRMDSTSLLANQKNNYDAAGDITNDGVNAYLYDGDGNICAVSKTVYGTSIMTGYIYDADGIRVAKGTITAWGSCDPTLNGFQSISETDYVLGPSGEQAAEVAMDANNTMAWAHTNAWAGGKLLATYDPTGLHFYLNDPLGTRRVQTDYEGVVEQTCSSLPFGDGLNCTGSSQYPTEHHFTGKERDSESGNDYFGARYYASSMGRFLSPDDGSDQDSGDPQSWNLYSYVRNNPLGGVDEDGHQVTVCSNVTNGDGSTGQSCNTISDDEYKAGVAAQKAADANNPPYAGFSAPGGDRPNGNITDNGQVVGTATWSANPVPDQGQVIPGDMGLSLVAGGMATDFVVGKVVGAIGNMLGSGAVDVAVRGGIGPVLKGAAGVDRAVAEIEAEGGQVVAKEVTIVTPAGRARVDIVYKDSSGNLVLGEAKNGPTAGLNPNQQAVYQAAQSGGARFVGGNASNAGLSGSIGPTQVRIFKY